MTFDCVCNKLCFFFSTYFFYPYHSWYFWYKKNIVLVITLSPVHAWAYYYEFISSTGSADQYTSFDTVLFILFRIMRSWQHYRYPNDRGGGAKTECFGTYYWYLDDASRYLDVARRRRRRSHHQSRSKYRVIEPFYYSYRRDEMHRIVLTDWPWWCYCDTYVYRLSVISGNQQRHGNNNILLTWQLKRCFVTLIIWWAIPRDELWM